MKKKFSLFIGILIGIIISGISVYAASEVFANQIKYKNGTVESALNDLYGNSTKYTCVYKNSDYGNSGNHLSIGTMYECDPGDNVKRNFYILAINGNEIKMIMEKNISDDVGSNIVMTYTEAMNFFNSGNAGYNVKNDWNKVSIDLPSAQDIADASLVMNYKNNWGFNVDTTQDTWFCLGSHEQDQPSGPLYCPSSSTQQKVSWLFNYTRDCESRGCTKPYQDEDEKPYGYWTKNLVYGSSSKAWNVIMNGNLATSAITNNSGRGVRPVIIVNKGNIKQ